MNKNDEQKIIELGKIVEAFANNESVPHFLRWGLQVLFICGSSSSEKSNVVAGLTACAERTFSEAIEKVRKSGDEAGVKKLTEDKANCLKMALAIDFAGAMASVLKQKLGEIDPDKDVIVGIGAPPTTPSPENIVIPTQKVGNPFAGRN